MRKFLRNAVLGFGLATSSLPSTSQAQDAYTEGTVNVIQQMEAYIVLSYNDRIGLAIRNDMNRKANADFNRTGGRFDLLTQAEEENIYFNNLLNNYSSNSYLKWSPQDRLIAGLCTLDATSVILGRYGLTDRKTLLDKYRSDLFLLYKRPTASQCNQAYQLGS